MATREPILRQAACAQNPSFKAFLPLGGLPDLSLRFLHAALEVNSFYNPCLSFGDKRGEQRVAAPLSYFIPALVLWQVLLSVQRLGTVSLLDVVAGVRGFEA